MSPAGAIAARELAPAQPVYLLDGPQPVFGLYHEPAEPRRPVAVLICPPFGNPEVCSYRARRAWARSLAGAGYSTLRIDLPATGDSGGGPGEEHLLAAWVGAVSTASSHLSTEAGADTVTAVGIGLGGLLACLAVAGGAGIDDLVLWGVPARGRSLVRELRAFSNMQASAGPGSGEDMLQDGSLVASGFRLSAETVAALEAVDLAGPEARPPRARRALLLERNEAGVDPRLEEALRAGGAEVTVRPGPGYREMMAPVFESRPPTEVFASVQDWLDQAGDHGDGAAPDAPEPRPAGFGRRAELVLDGVAITETPLRVMQPFGPLFGVLSEPAGPAGADLCVVFVNAGALRRIGPDRLWVEAARRFAASGVPALRIDLGGIGEAAGDDTRWGDDASFYVPEFVAQVRAVLDQLVALDLPRRFVLAGLCSGAYWSFHAALQDERVAGAWMVNPRALFWDRSRTHAEEAAHARQLRRRETWLKLLHGGFSARRILTFLGAVAGLAADIPGRLLDGDADGGDRLEGALDRLQATGKRVLFVFGPQEPLRLELERDGRLAAIAKRANVTVELLPGEQEAHTLEPIRLQRDVHRALDHALAEELARAGSGT